MSPKINIKTSLDDSLSEHYQFTVEKILMSRTSANWMDKFMIVDHNVTNNI